MKVCVTKVTEITGKDGREWTKLDFVTADGSTGTAMYKKGEHSVTPDEKQLAYDTDLQFDNRGRLTAVE